MLSLYTGQIIVSAKRLSLSTVLQSVGVAAGLEAGGAKDSSVGCVVGLMRFLKGVGRSALEKLRGTKWQLLLTSGCIFKV